MWLMTAKQYVVKSLVCSTEMTHGTVRVSKSTKLILYTKIYSHEGTKNVAKLIAKIGKVVTHSEGVTWFHPLSNV